MSGCTGFVALLVLLPGLTAAGGTVDASSAPDTQGTIDEPLYAAPTRLDRIGRIVAPVTINGQGPFRFIVDTGANRSVVTAQLASTLGLQTSHDQSITLRGVTGAIVVPTVAIDHLRTGDLVQQSLRLPVLETVMGGADGILGMEGFEDKRITVDFVNDRIEIARSQRQHAPWKYITLPARMHFGRLMAIDAKVGWVRVQAIVDTGAERTLGNLALRDALLRRRELGSKGATQVIGLNLVEENAHAIRTPTISMDRAAISNVAVVYGDIDVFRLWDLQERPALLLGMDVLGTLNTLIIDYRMKEVQIRTR